MFEPIENHVLAYIFSFLSDRELVKIRLVCRNWAAVGVDNQLWKPRVHVALHNLPSNSESYFALFMKSIYNRKNIYLVIGNVGYVYSGSADLPKPKTINLEPAKTALQGSSVFFSNPLDAEFCADAESKTLKENNEEGSKVFYFYKMVFTVKVRDDARLSKTIRAVGFKEREKWDTKYLPCFFGNPDKIEKIFSASYKVGFFYSPTKITLKVIEQPKTEPNFIERLCSLM